MPGFEPLFDGGTVKLEGLDVFLRDRRMIKSYEVQNAGDYPDDWCLLRHRLWPDTTLDDHRAELQESAKTAPDSSSTILMDRPSVSPRPVWRRDYSMVAIRRPWPFSKGFTWRRRNRRQGVAAALVTEVTRWGDSPGRQRTRLRCRDRQSQLSPHACGRSDLRRRSAWCIFAEGWLPDIPPPGVTIHIIKY